MLRLQPHAPALLHRSAAQAATPPPSRRQQARLAQWAAPANAPAITRAIAAAAAAAAAAVPVLGISTSTSGAATGSPTESVPTPVCVRAVWGIIARARGGECVRALRTRVPAGGAGSEVAIAVTDAVGIPSLAPVVPSAGTGTGCDAAAVRVVSAGRGTARSPRAAASPSGVRVVVVVGWGSPPRDPPRFLHDPAAAAAGAAEAAAAAVACDRCAKWGSCGRDPPIFPSDGAAACCAGVAAAPAAAAAAAPVGSAGAAAAAAACAAVAVAGAAAPASIVLLALFATGWSKMLLPSCRTLSTCAASASAGATRWGLLSRAPCGASVFFSSLTAGGTGPCPPRFSAGGLATRPPRFLTRPRASSQLLMAACWAAMSVLVSVVVVVCSISTCSPPACNRR